MEQHRHIELAKSCLVEIATPYNTGTGFYVEDYGLVVTNEHVVRDNKEVVIKGATFDKQIAKVLLIDEHADIAFIEAPAEHKMPRVELNLEDIPSQGAKIFTIGHPYGLKLSTTQGVISSIEQRERGLTFIQHDAALNPGNSGGPLVDEQGRILGLNSFVLRKGENISFALPITVVQATFEGYSLLPADATSSARCRSCRAVIFDNQDEEHYCPKCGAEVLFPSSIRAYKALGIARIIEDIISDLGYDVRLTREGKNHWNIPRGSALVRLSYHKDAGLIDGDAYLCRLPDQDLNEIYTFLLQENFKAQDLVFSIKGQFVLLSLLIFDRHLDEDTGRVMLERLFEQADHYDDIIIDRFGASWILEQ